MKLTELEAKFLHAESIGRFSFTDKISEVDGVMFLCPVCFVKNGGEIGTHSMICWQPHIPPEMNPGPGRWLFHGTGVNDLTLDNTEIKMSSSVLMTGDCNAHFHIRNGQIEMCV